MTTVGKTIGRTSQPFVVTKFLAGRTDKLQLPEFIPISQKRRIMRGEVIIGFFKKVMEGERLEGRIADEMRNMLTYQRYECEVLTCVSLDLANRFARKLTKITGEEFRVQTEEEWEEAKDLLAGRHFTWTTTLAEPTKEQTKYVLRQLGSRLRYPLPSDYCSSLETAIRLVRESGG